jgi:SAM-dependent methyltransferase
MEYARQEAASFRDPAGHVLRVGKRVFRTVSPRGVANYEFVRDSGFLSDPVASDRIIASEEVSPQSLGSVTENAEYVLEHPPLSFISYPYEWCFSALKSAALLQLSLLEEALCYDMTMSDASAYNIQFQGPNPIFIDVLSFCRYREGDYWTAHQQFCEQFLNPLLLTALRGVSFNAWYRGNLEGLESAELNRLLDWRQKLSWRVLTHVTLPVRLQTKARVKAGIQIDRINRRRLPRASFQQLIGGLRNWISGLTPAKSEPSAWCDYASENSYDKSAAAAKVEFTRRFASSVQPKTLWDLGCNTGEYTEIALHAGADEAIGFDIDSGAIEAAFQRATQKGLHFLPLLIDAANPSPGQGWRGQERKSFKARATADGLLAYAFVHHLSIGRNIPLAQVVTWLVELAPQGVIEFVEKDDPMVAFMLQLRDDIFDDYRRDTFLAALGKHAEIVETQEIIEKRRLLVWYRRRTSEC